MKENRFWKQPFRETEEETGISANTIDIDPKFEFDLFYEVQYPETGDQSFSKNKSATFWVFWTKNPS